MSHQEKQEVFDRISQENYKEKFEEFLMYTLFEVENGEITKSKAIGEITDLVFAACDLVQEEQQKRISESITMKYHDGSTKNDSFIEYYQIGADNLQVDKSSIINPENQLK